MKKTFFVLIVIIVNLAVIFAIGEIYARAKHGEVLAFQAREAAYRRSDTELHHSFIPGARARSIAGEWNVEYSINSLGLRDREYPAKKGEGARRTLILGDSYVEGYGVRQDEAFPKVLEKLLNGGSSKGKYEVINGGIASYSPALEYLFLRKNIGRIDPDVVILFYDFGDLKDDYEYETTACAPYKRVRAYSSCPVEKFFLAHSRFYVYLENRINKVMYKLSGRRVKLDEADRFVAFKGGEDEIRKLWERNERNLSSINELLSQKGIKFVIVSYPYAMEVSPAEWAEGRVLHGFEAGRTYPEPSVVKYLEEFAKKGKIPFINLYEDFKNCSEHPLFYPFDGHWNAAGHKLVAQLLHRALGESIFEQ